MFEMNDNQKSLFDALTSLQKEISLNSISGMNDIDAYKNSKGKAKTIKAMEAAVSKLLSNVKVKAFIDSIQQEAVKGAVMTRKEMLERLSNLARVNMSDLIEWNVSEGEDDEGNPIKQTIWAIKKSAQQDPHAMASIAEVTAGKEGFKIKQHSPLSAMKQLADLEGYNSAKQIDHSVKIEKADDDDW